MYRCKGGVGKGGGESGGCEGDGYGRFIRRFGVRESMMGWDLCDLVVIRVYNLLLYLIVKYGDLDLIINN